jgi:hypothetical protein
VNWNEIQRILRETEDARRALEETRHIRETLDRVDSATLRAIREQQNFGVNSMVNEIIRQNLLRNEGRDHAISEYFKRRSAVDEFLETHSRVLRNQARINEIVNSVSDAHSVKELLLNLPQALPGLESALQPYRKLHESYITGIRGWENLGQQIIQQNLGYRRAEQAALAAVNWGTNVQEIVERITTLDAIQRRPDFAALMLEPAFAYGRFATATMSRLPQASEPEQNALEGSLILAEDQIVRITATQESMIETSEEEDEGDTQPSTRLSFDLFEEQQGELLSRKEEVPPEADFPTLVNLSPSAELFERCNRCFILIDYCNGASCDRGGGNIFNPATSWLLISAALAGKITRDRNSFKDFVLNFYNLLYESVSPRRRLLRDGLVTEAEYRVIEVLKDFRNKWLVHDATQGSAAGVGDDRRIITDHLSWLGTPRLPLESVEFELLQQRLFDEIEAFLALLVSRLSPPPPPGSES